MALQYNYVYASYNIYTIFNFVQSTLFLQDMDDCLKNRRGCGFGTRDSKRILFNIKVVTAIAMVEILMIIYTWVFRMVRVQEIINVWQIHVDLF